MKDLIETEVKRVLSQDEFKSLYIPLVNHFTEAFGVDTSWTELYTVTGELVVPEVLQDSDFQDSDFGDKLSTITKVGQKIFSSSPPLRYTLKVARH